MLSVVGVKVGIIGKLVLEEVVKLDEDEESEDRSRSDGFIILLSEAVDDDNDEACVLELGTGVEGKLELPDDVV